MAKKDTVKKKDETLEDRIVKIESSTNWLAAVVRKLEKRAEKHWGIDLNQDGKIGSTRIVMVQVMLGLCIAGFLAFAADTTIVNWGTGVSGTIGTAQITSDGTSATLSVDKLAVGKTSTMTSNLTISGNLTVAGTNAVTGRSYLNGGATITGTGTVSSNLTVSGNVAIAGTNGVTGAIYSAGRAVATAPSSTGYMMESGTNIGYAVALGQSMTQTFSTAFASAPVVIYRYTANEIIASNACTSTTTNFVVAPCQTTFVWIAIGPK